MRMVHAPAPPREAQGNYEHSVVAALLEAHPAAATCRDEENLLPLDHAVSYGMSTHHALAALVAADMPIDTSGAPAVRHQASWTKAVTMPRMTARIGLLEPQALHPTTAPTPTPTPTPTIL